MSSAAHPHARSAPRGAGEHAPFDARQLALGDAARSVGDTPIMT
jgi:hypothetical protein